MIKNFENIEIVEPPIEELTKKRAWGGACLTSLVLLVVLLIIFIIGLRLYIGSGPQTYRTVPNSFPSDVPVYDKNNVEKITFISARYKERGIGIATLLPKLILSPILYNDEGAGNTVKKILAGTEAGNKKSDTIQIEWHGLNSEPSFIVSYYKKELAKKNFKIDVESTGKNIRQFSFSREDGVSGSIYALGNTEKNPATEYLLLTVNIAKWCAKNF